MRQAHRDPTLSEALGIDTAYHKGDWKGVAPLCEVVICDFDEHVQASPAPEKTPLADESEPAKQVELFPKEAA